MIDEMDGSEYGTFYFVRDGSHQGRVQYAVLITFEILHEAVYFMDSTTEQPPHRSYKQKHAGAAARGHRPNALPPAAQGSGNAHRQDSSRVEQRDTIRKGAAADAHVPHHQSRSRRGGAQWATVAEAVAECERAAPGPAAQPGHGSLRCRR